MCKMNYKLFFFGVLLAIFTGNTKVNAQEKGVLWTAPEQLTIANSTFQFGTYGRYMLQREYALWSKNEDQKKLILEELSRLFPTIRDDFSRSSLPQDFRYLVNYPIWQATLTQARLLPPHVYWCFTQERAREVLLQMDEFVDGRKHILFATKAAIASLQRQRILYKNPGAVLWSHLADKSVLESEPNLVNWGEKDTILLDEPKYYALYKFFAYKLVFEELLQKFKPDNQVIIFEYPYGRGKEKSQIAQELSIAEAQVEEYNFWLLQSEKTGKEYPLLIPISVDRYFETKNFVEFIHAPSSGGSSFNYPKIQGIQPPKKAIGNGFFSINGKKGIRAELHDSFVDLAYRGGISVKDIKLYNDVVGDRIPVVGDIYYLEAKEEKGPKPFHILQSSENLWQVAQKYGVKLKKLVEYNFLSNEFAVEPGLVLWLQGKRPKDKSVEIVSLPEESFYMQNPERARHEPVILVPIDTDMPLPEPISEEEEVLEEEVEPNTLPKTEDDGWNDKPLKKTKSKTEPEPKIVLMHRVKKGETLFRLSVIYKVTVEQIQEWNGLKDNLIKEGTLLRVGFE